MNNPNRISEVEPSALSQAYGTLVETRLGLTADVRHRSVAVLNRLLAHTLSMRDLYKKSHWQTSGPLFFELHRMFDKHHDEQMSLADALGERVQTLGGVALALPHDVACESPIARAPRGRENPFEQLRRLSGGHETILIESRSSARLTSESGDDGTNDLIVSQLIRTNETQSWFVSEHLARDCDA